MQALNINDKVLIPKINFRFRSVLGKKLGDEQDQSGFTKLITGLVQQDPDALLTFYEAALAKDHPNQEDLFDALDEQILKDDVTEKAAFKDAVNELNNSGFFKMKAKAWKKYNEQLRAILQTQLDALGDKDDQESAKMRTSYTVGLQQINDAENLFDKMVAPEKVPSPETAETSING